MADPTAPIVDQETEIERLRTALAEARADVQRRDAALLQLQGMIAALQSETSALRASIDLLHVSASWRVSAPLRIAGRLARGLRKAAFGLPGESRRARPVHVAPLVPPPTASPTPGDPNAGIIFQAAPFVEQSSGDDGIVTLDALYHLSRSL